MAWLKEYSSDVHASCKMPEYIADMINAHELLGRKIEEWKIANLATL